MLKRLTAMFLVLALLVAVFAGCNQTPSQPSGSSSESSDSEAPPEDGEDVPEPSGEEVVLTYWKAPHGEDEADLWAPIIAKFEEENPGIKIDFLVTPWETWTEKYTAAFAGGTPPDVSYMTEGFPQFADNDMLHDLSSYAPADIDQMAGYNTAMYKGKLIGISFLTLASVLYYNTDMFEAAGLEPPKDWDELREAAKQLTTDDVWGFAPPLNTDYPHITGQFIAQTGCTMLNDDMTALGWNSPEGEAGIQLLYDMMWVDNTIPKWDAYTLDEYQNLFSNGKSAMTIEQSQVGNDIKAKNPDLNFEIQTVPVGPASDEKAARANYGGVGFLSIAEACQYKDEAYKFIEYCTIDGGATSYLTTRNFFSGFENINEEMYQGDPYMEIAQAAAADIYLHPVVPNFLGEISSELKLMFEKIFRNEQDIATAVNECDEVIQGLLAE